MFLELGNVSRAPGAGRRAPPDSFEFKMIILNSKLRSLMKRIRLFPFHGPWALFFGSRKSLTENLNSFRATKIADPVIYFLSARFARPSGDPNLRPAGFTFRRTPAGVCVHPLFPHHCPRITTPGYVGAQVSVAS